MKVCPSASFICALSMCVGGGHVSLKYKGVEAIMLSSVQVGLPFVDVQTSAVSKHISSYLQIGHTHACALNPKNEKQKL